MKSSNDVLSINAKRIEAIEKQIVSIEHKAFIKCAELRAQAERIRFDTIRKLSK
jgi:hypothetical protein